MKTQISLRMQAVDNPKDCRQAVLRWQENGKTKNVASVRKESHTLSAAVYSPQIVIEQINDLLSKMGTI